MRLKMRVPLGEVAHWFKFTPCNLGINEWSGFFPESTFWWRKGRGENKDTRKSSGGGRAVCRGKGEQKGDESLWFRPMPTALLAAPSSGYQAAWYGGPVGLLSAQTWFETHCVPLASYPTSLHLNFLTCKMRLIKSIVQGCFGNLYFILIVVKYT